MQAKNSVYIATSLDGFIADQKGALDWLESVPNPEQNDMGYPAFMERIDALVMGRNTFETVLGFDVPWPYEKPVFVLSNRLEKIPASHQGKAHLIKGSLTSVLQQIHEKGYKRLYIDGGKTVQEFLKQDLIDEMIITTFPILLGGGTPLFGELANPLAFELIDNQTLLGLLTQRHFIRKR